MKKLIYTIFIVVLLILANVCTVFADSGVSNVNITFIVLTCILAPALVGVIVYYALKAKKVKTIKIKKENPTLKSVILEGGEYKMSEVKVNNGNIEDALKRFKRQCARNGVLQEVRKREHYEKPSVRRKKKSEAARKRKF